MDLVIRFNHLVIKTIMRMIVNIKSLVEETPNDQELHEKLEKDVLG